MTTTLPFRNRIRRYLPPTTAFWQPPPEIDRLLWFLLGVLVGLLLHGQLVRALMVRW